MATNYVHGEDTIQFTATTTARSSGDVVTLGEIVCVLKVDVAASGTGAAFTAGKFSALTKTTAADVAVGEKVYWTGSGLTSVATSNTFFGVSESAATTGATSIDAKLLSLGG